MMEYNIQEALNEAYFASEYQKIIQSASNDNTSLLESEDDENREGIKGDIVYGM